MSVSGSVSTEQWDKVSCLWSTRAFLATSVVFMNLQPIIFVCMQIIRFHLLSCK